MAQGDVISCDVTHDCMTTVLHVGDSVVTSHSQMTNRRLRLILLPDSDVDEL
jgi:hypothetical protein